MQLLEATTCGDRQAAAELLPLAHDELRKLAAVRMAQEKPGQTRDATAFILGSQLGAFVRPGRLTDGDRQWR